MRKQAPKPQPRFGIYAITDVATGRQYIGSSSDIDKRWRGHLATLRGRYHENRHLQAIYDAHGAEGLTLTVIELVMDGRDLWAVEEEYLARHFSGPQRGGLNIRMTTGRVHGPESGELGYTVSGAVVDAATRWLFERLHEQMGHFTLAETAWAMVHECATARGIRPPTPEELAAWKQRKATAA